jgi:hypothetical protein
MSEAEFFRLVKRSGLIAELRLLEDLFQTGELLTNLKHVVVFLGRPIHSDH